MILPLLLPIMLALNTTVVEFIAKAGQQLVISSGICIVISCLSVIGNLIDVLINGYKSDISAAVLMHTYFAGILILAGLNIFAVKSGNYSILFASFSTWAVLFVYWLTLCSVLYSDWFAIQSLCLNNRCPESFWFTNWYYHSVTVEDKALAIDKVGVKPPRPSSTTPIPIPTITQTASEEEILTTQYEFYDEPENIFSVSNFIPNFYSLFINKEGNSSNEPIFNTNFWSKLFSVLICLNFMLFLTMLGSLVWNICNSICLKKSGGNQPVTHGYIYMFQLRRSSQEGQGDSQPSSTAQPGATTASGPSATTAPQTKQNAKAPQAPPAPKTPQAPPAPKAPQALPAPKAPQDPSAPKAPQPTPAPKAPQVPPVSTAPSAPQAHRAKPAPKD